MTKNGRWITMRNIWLGMEFQTGREERRRRRTEIERKRAEKSRNWEEKLNLGSSVRENKNNPSTLQVTWHGNLLELCFYVFFLSHIYFPSPYFYKVLDIRFGRSWRGTNFELFTCFPGHSKGVCNMSEFRGKGSFLNEDVWLWLCSSRLFAEMSEAKAHSISP